MLFYVLITLFSAIPESLAELLCVSCTDIPSPSLCNQVAKCGRFDECFVESYVNGFGSVRFDLGCRDSQFCNRPRSNLQPAGRQAGPIHMCTECCNGTVCNFAGCGKNGIPHRDQRGPMCFNCQTELSLDGCSTIKQCNRGEVCVLEANASHITGERVYTTGCMKADVCDNAYKSFGYLSIGNGKRNFDHSVHVGTECKIECCDGDFCNRACNITKQNNGAPMTSSVPAITSSAQSMSSSTTVPTFNNITTSPGTTPSPSTSPPVKTTLVSATDISSRSPAGAATPPVSLSTATTASGFGVLTSVSSLLGQSGCSDHIYLCRDPAFQTRICQPSGASLYCPKSCHLCTFRR